MGGVEAADVEGRVGLGIAELLRFLQAHVEGQTLLLHAREDVVAGAVEDSVDAVDAAAAETLTQGLDDRNAARDRGFERQRRVVGLGEFCQCDAMVRQQRLVGGDHGLPGGERRLDRALGGIAGAAHQLDKHVDAAIARERNRVGDLAHLREIERRVPRRVLRSIGHEIDRPAGPFGDGVAGAQEHRGDGGADRAQSGEAHSQRFGHGRIQRRKAQPRLASGTTLCSLSGAVSRKRRMLRAACRMRCSFSTSAMRT